MKADCSQFKKFLAETSGKPAAATALCSQADSTHAQEVMGESKVFLSRGTVEINGSKVPINIYRDTGAFISLFRYKSIPELEGLPTIGHIKVKGAFANKMKDLKQILLNSDLISGQCTVAMVDELPIGGVDLLLGNDLVGGKVWVKPQDPTKESNDPRRTELERSVPTAFPSCVGTRNQLRDQYTPSTDCGELLNTSSPTTEVTHTASHLLENPWEGQPISTFSPSELVQKQRSDLELRSMLDSVGSEEEKNKETKKEMKTVFDRKEKECRFKSGDKVLVRLPMVGHALQATFSGPYIVEEKLGPVNYMIRTPDREKKKRVCHINILEKYIDREEQRQKAVAVAVSSDEVSGGYQNAEKEENLPVGCRVENSEAMKDLPILQPLSSD